MKRRKFMQASLLTVPFTMNDVIPAAADRSSKGFKIASGEGRFHGHIQLKGVNANSLDVKISGKDTNGDLAVFEQTSLSPKRGTPLHVHPNQDEIFQIQKGEYRFQVGKEQHQLKAGDSIFLPRKIPHAWTQVSETGRMTVILQPAGMLEEFFVKIASLKVDPSKEEIAKIFADHDMQVVGPPLRVE